MREEGYYWTQIDNIEVILFWDEESETWSWGTECYFDKDIVWIGERIPTPSELEEHRKRPYKKYTDEELTERYVSACDARDWGACDVIHEEKLIRKLEECQ